MSIPILTTCLNDSMIMGLLKVLNTVDHATNNLKNSSTFNSRSFIAILEEIILCIE